MIEGNNKQNGNNEERENYKFIVLFYFLGTACFVPNSFYGTANGYWMYKFRNTSVVFSETETQKTILQKIFYAYSGVCSSFGSVIFIFGTILLRNKIRLQQRIIGSMFLLLVLFTITMILTFVDTDSWQAGFFVIALAVSGLLGCTTSVLLISLFQLSRKFSQRCLAAQLAGQSICGIMAAVIQVLALLVGPSVQITAALYYAIAVGTLASIFVVYILVLCKSKEFQNKLNYKPSEAVAAAQAFKFDKAILKSALRKSALLMTALVLCVSSSMFHTGLTVLIEPSGKGTNIWSDTYFIPVCVFLLCPVVEFIGRELSNYPKILKNIYVIFGTSVLRVALFPLIILCNLQPRQHLPVLFHNDAFFIIFLMLLAVSSGYILNIAIVAIPRLCEPNEMMMATLLIVLVMIIFVPIFTMLSGSFVNVI